MLRRGCQHDAAEHRPRYEEDIFCDTRTPCTMGIFSSDAFSSSASEIL